MSSESQASSLFPIATRFSRGDFEFPIYGGGDFSLELRSGLTSLVGPNGSGKTRVLYAIRNKLRTVFGSQQVRFVSAGRMGAIEQFRSAMNGHEGDGPGISFVGNQGWLTFRKQSESLVGDFMALSERVDLRMKVGARLESLFGKRLGLSWTQSGLQIEYRAGNGSIYGAGKEASGLVHLTGLLAALYDDEIKAVLIDEPEVSLHPQLQSFLLSELREVAGDPSVHGKKILVICTHSPLMLPARRVDDLTSTVFFRGPDIPPTQLAPDDGLLKGGAIAAFVASFAEVHRLAMFAQSVLLVEGPSDEMIVNALVEIGRRPLAAAGVQVIPVNGKSNISTVAKFFRALGKKVNVLADLDAFVDSNALTNIARQSEGVQQVVERMGHGSLNDFDKAVRARLAAVVDSHWDDISALAVLHPYHFGTQDPTLARRRSALGTLFRMTDAEIDQMASRGAWRGLRAQWTSFFEALSEAGFFALRLGAVESYYYEPKNFITAKPEEAAKEIEVMLSEQPHEVLARYSDVVKALDFAGKLAPVDEAVFLRRALGAVVGAATVNLRPDVDDAAIQSAVADASPDYAKMFTVTNASIKDEAAIRVTMNSTLFKGYNFPFVFRAGQAITSLENTIPSPK